MYRSVVSTTAKNGLTLNPETIVIEFTWDENGNRVERTSVVKPYLYYEDEEHPNTNYKSMFNKPLSYKEFDTEWERKQWISNHKNIPLYEKFSSQRQYLFDKYCGMERDESFSKNKFRIFYMDIEIEIEDVFPDPETADYPINVISLYDSLEDNIHVWVYNKKISSIMSDDKLDHIREEITKYSKIPNIVFHNFNSEIKMMKDFIKFWENNFPDIITGWNVDDFDMLYIINRIIKLFGDKEHFRLSPVNNRVKNPVYSTFEKQQKNIVRTEPKAIYRIKGISICDYINLYKKFEGTSRQSFKLDYIANFELGIGKFDYYEIGYESMKDFMQKDFSTFVLYNIIDTLLIKLLDDKLKLINLMRKICNLGLCEYENIFQSLPYILGAVAIQSRKMGVKYMTDSNKSEDKKDISDGFEGAFVFPTKAGYYKNGIVSLDFNSLYPNTIMTLNLSPETKVGKIIEKNPFELDKITIKKTNGDLIKVNKENFQKILDEKCTIAPNGVLYVKPSIKFGIVPTLLDGLYKERVSVKSHMKQCIKTIEKIDKAIEIVEEKIKKLS